MTIKDRLARLADPASPAFGAASTAIVAALTLVDPERLSRAGRRGFRVVSAVATGFYVGVAVDRDGTIVVPARVMAGVAVGGVAFAAADLSDALDGRIVRRLCAVGFRHPRWWLAAGAGAATFLTHLADRAAAGRDGWREFADDPGMLRPVDPAARALMAGILNAAQVPGSEALLGQLAVAQARVWDDEFSTTLQFAVPDRAPRVVPHNHVYPVRARFEAFTGQPLEVLLQVYNGKLEHMAIDAPVDGYPGSIEELVDRWPDATRVSYVRDGADGQLSPVEMA